MTELAVTRDLHLVALHDDELATLNSRYPTYTGYEIPGDTYNGVSDGVQALGIWSAVVVHEAMPEAVAYDLTCAIYQHRDALLKVSPVARAGWECPAASPW